MGACEELCQRSWMKLFAKIVNGFKPLFILAKIILFEFQFYLF